MVLARVVRARAPELLYLVPRCPPEQLNAANASAEMRRPASSVPSSSTVRSPRAIDLHFLPGKLQYPGMFSQSSYPPLPLHAMQQNFPFQSQ
jgi:hypothetical protein